MCVCVQVVSLQKGSVVATNIPYGVRLRDHEVRVFTGTMFVCVCCVIQKRSVVATNVPYGVRLKDHEVSVCVFTRSMCLCVVCVRMCACMVRRGVCKRSV